MNYNSSKNQRIKSRFVASEIGTRVSHLVSELAKQAEHFPEYEEDLYGAFCVDEWEDPAREHISELDIDGRQDIVGDEPATQEDVLEYAEGIGWQEFCIENDIESNTLEVLEHWLITDYLANRLEEHGEKVLRDFFGLTVWCRTCSGQAIMLDGVISEICAGMEILEGQKNEWRT